MPETLKEKQRKNMLARRIKEIRTSKSLSQFDLAKLMDCTQGLISQYESGTSNISLSIVIDIADVLGCSIDYLLGRDAQYDVSLRGRLYKAFEALTSTRQSMIITMIEAVVGTE